MSVEPSPSNHQPIRVGEISVVDGTVIAPGVSMPLAGSRWTLNDQRVARTYIPPHVIALAVIFGVLLCGLGLLFLLINETTFEGQVHVTVANGERVATTSVTAATEQAAQALRDQVTYAQRLAEHFAHWGQ